MRCSKHSYGTTGGTTTISQSALWNAIHAGADYGGYNVGTGIIW